jgi:hypothetical protein
MSEWEGSGGRREGRREEGGLAAGKFAVCT